LRATKTSISPYYQETCQPVHPLCP
jgi:hypothetical protein